jgi:hypothetical protein
MILAIVKLVLSFADGLMEYMNDKQLLDAGAHVATSKNLQRALNAVREANDIRERVRAGELSDPFLDK